MKMALQKSHWMTELFQSFGDDAFLIFHDQVYSYRDLVNEVQSWSQILEDRRIEPGMNVAIISDYSPNTIFLFVALMINDNLVVPLDRAAEEGHQRFLEIAEVQVIFEIDEADKWECWHTHVNPDHELMAGLRERGEAGIVIFSSGTTGNHKASLLSANRLLGRFRETSRQTDRTLVFLKLDHIGGINTLFGILLRGGTLVTCADRNARSVCGAIEAHSVAVLPTTPTFLNMMLLSSAQEDFDLSSLKVITYGTEPMPQSTLIAVHKALPQVRLKQTYGLTELGIFPTKSKDSTSTWMKVGGQGVEVQIREGSLWVRSEMAMLGYLNAPSPFDAEGWYPTHDRVLEEDGYLRILGREQEMINVGGEKVYPAEVESVLLEMPNVVEVVVTGKKNPITGQTVAASVVVKRPQTAMELSRDIQNFCSTRLARYKIPTFVKVVEGGLVSTRFKKLRSETSKQLVAKG